MGTKVAARSRAAAQLDKQSMERVSRFRYALRRFLRFSEDASRDAGITVLQYQLLLHTQGFPGREVPEAEAVVGHR